MISKNFYHITQNIPPSTGADLMGFKYDCADAITHDLFHKVTIEETKNGKNLLVVQIEITDGFDSVHHLKSSVIELYRLVEYHHFSSYLIEYNNSEMVFSFITAPQTELFFVSGKIIFSGPHYQDLYSKSQVSS